MNKKINDNKQIQIKTIKDKTIKDKTIKDKNIETSNNSNPTDKEKQFTKEKKEIYLDNYYTKEFIEKYFI